MNAIEDHPLVPHLKGWAAARPPFFPFAPTDSEFMEGLNTSGLPWLLAHHEAKQKSLQTYHRSKLLALTMTRKDVPTDLHSLIYHATAGSPLAFALVDACAMSFFPQSGAEKTQFKMFSIACRLDGFLDALKHWADHMEYGKEGTGPGILDKLVKNEIPRESGDAAFWMHAALDDFGGDAYGFAEALTAKKIAFEKSKARKEYRGTSRTPAAYKHHVAFGWLPMSFWIQTSEEISSAINPKPDNAEAAAKNVGRCISVLRFSTSHLWRHGEALKAELKKL